MIFNINFVWKHVNNMYSCELKEPVVVCYVLKMDGYLVNHYING